MTLNDAEREAHIAQSKYTMLLQDRKRINEAVERQHTELVKANARVRELKGKSNG